MMIQPQIDFCCFRLVAINIVLTHCYKLVSFFKFIIIIKSVIKGMYKIGIDSQSRALAVIVEFLLSFRLLVVNVNITMFCSW